MLLAVETSGMQGSVAICQDDELIAERILVEGGPRHAQTLVSEVNGLLQNFGLTPRDIDAVAVSIGPGSFTGLRVGLVFAKTLAWLNHAKLVAVDTLRVVAQQAPANLPCVTAVIDAQRGEVFTGTYRTDASSGIRELINDVHVATAQSLSIEYPLTGPGLAKLTLDPDIAVCRLDSSLWQPRAATVAVLGRVMLSRGELSVPETLEPVYVRVSYAEEKRQAQHLLPK